MDPSIIPLLESHLQISPPKTMLKQYYSLPSPITKYMFENASAINYFKLFQSCKLLNKLIDEKYGPQIDVLEVGNLKNHSPFFTLKVAKKEIKIRGSDEICQYFPKTRKLCVKKRLLLKHMSLNISYIYLNKLNCSTIKEIYFINARIRVCDYKKLLVPTIEVVYFSFLTGAYELDIIYYTLKNLPNLRIFKLPWNRYLTNFAELTTIKRKCKLEKAEIYNFLAEFDENNLSGFISEQMSPNSTLYFCFRNEIPKSVETKNQNFADEFNIGSPTKIMIR